MVPSTWSRQGGTIATDWGTDHATPFVLHQAAEPGINPPDKLQDNGMAFMLNNSDYIVMRWTEHKWHSFQALLGQSLWWSTRSQGTNISQQCITSGGRDSGGATSAAETSLWPYSREILWAGHRRGETATSSHLSQAWNYRLKINKMSQSSPFIVPWKCPRLLPSVYLQRGLLIHCILSRSL